MIRIVGLVRIFANRADEFAAARCRRGVFRLALGHRRKSLFGDGTVLTELRDELSGLCLDDTFLIWFWDPQDDLLTGYTRDLFIGGQFVIFGT